MKVKEKFIKQATELHRHNPVVDAHLDLAGEILLRYQAGEKEVIRTYYLDHFKKAGLTLLISSVYVDDSVLPEGGLRNALDQISVLYEDIAAASDDVMLVKTRRELRYARQHGKIGILLYMEGLDCIGTDLRLLPVLYELGIRGASLTWSRRNQLATGCCRSNEKKPIPGGLSDVGLQAVRELEHRSCFVDVSHLNDDGFEQLAEAAVRPFLATHSNARSVYDSYRNLTDPQILSLCKKGGIIGINGHARIAGSAEKSNHLEMLCRHVEHIVKLTGSRHVGYGFDLCDSYSRAEPRLSFNVENNNCLENHSEMILLTAALLQRGLPEKDVTAIIGGNFYSFIDRILK